MSRIQRLFVVAVLASGVPGLAWAAGFTAEPSMVTARELHTATMLPSGLVLVAGGLGSTGALSSAELFDPGTSTWSAAGSLATARYGHTATLLANGQVLVVGGGDNSGNSFSSAELYNSATNTWSAAGSLANSRFDHTATLLSSGQVLVTGGANTTNYLSSAELYDPGTNTWSTTGSLVTARYYHTATLLSSGKVLVAGGYNGGYLSSAELYDPGTSTWSAAGSLATPRQYHTATLLSNGDVLAAGGYNDSSGVLSSAELYNPGTNTWSTAGSLANARNAHTATLLPSGQVLVIGGANTTNYLSSAELFDAGTNTWSTTGSLATARWVHTATLLSNGKVLVTGGYNEDYLSSAELYDPTLGGVWAPSSSLANGRYSHTATLLPNGKVLVAGGIGNPSSAELYDPGSNTWSAAGSLANARFNHTATLLPNGKVLIVGGKGNGILSSTELYDPGSNIWSVVGSLAIARYNHTATLLSNGKVLVAGGDDNGTSLSSAELYDPGTNTWSAAGSLANARESHTATLISGKVLVSGGIDFGNSVLSTAELYDPGSNTWSAAGSLANARESHTATLLPSGKVLVAGGLGAETSAELYDPGTNTWSASGSLANARYSHTATLLPNGKVLVAGGVNAESSAELYDLGTNTWSTAGNLTTFRDLHTATLLPNGKVLVAGGIDAPSSAELYDSTSGGAWSAAGNLANARYNHTATLISNGMVLVAGGYNGSYLSSAELYDPSTNTWSATGNLNTSRESHSATLLPSGQVLVVGGYHKSGPFAATSLSGSEIYDPETNTWSVAASIAVPVGEHTATLLTSGKVLVAGGVDKYISGSLLLRRTEQSAGIYDPSTGTWDVAGSMMAPRAGHAANLLPNGDVLVEGGSGDTSAELYSPSTNAWSAAGNLAAARVGHTATLLPNGKVLVAGGTDDFGNVFSSAELYDPGANTWSAAGSLITARVGHTATLLPNGKVLVAAGADQYSNALSSAEVYDPSANTWNAVASLGTARSSLTATLLLSGEVLAAGYLSNAELYDNGLGFQSSWQPLITAVSTPLVLGANFDLIGSQFTGISEASGGATNSSPSNNPVVQLRSIANEQSVILTPDPARPWTSNSYQSTPVSGFPIGAALATVYVNGTPSNAFPITIDSSLMLNILSGSPQSAMVNSTFGAALKVLLVGQPSGLPISNATVSFVVPSTGPGGTFGGTTNVLTDSNGVATAPAFTANTAAGNYNVTASYVGVSVNFTLANNPGNATSLVVAGFPSPSTAGVAENFTVTAIDAYGNIATGYTGTVTFTSSDGKFVKPANYTFQAADNGTQIFSATCKTAATQSITATDMGNGAINGTQSGITVNSAAASTFSLSGANSQTAGFSQNITVTALDAYGNTAVSYAGTSIQFSGASTAFNGTSPTAGPDALHQTNFNSPFLASFTNGIANETMFLYKAETKSITVTDGTISAAPGLTVVVSPGTATQFALSPNSGAINSGIAFSLTVTAQDAYQNTVVAGYSGTVTLSSTDTTATAIVPGQQVAQSLPVSYTYLAGPGQQASTVTLNTLGNPITVTAKDSSAGFFNSASYSVVSTTGPTSPLFTIGPDQKHIPADIGPVIVNGWATGIVPGVPGDTPQSLTFKITNITGANLFTVQPTVVIDPVQAIATLSYTPNPNSAGTSVISLVLKEGTLSSSSQTFTIQIDGAPPSFTGNLSTNGMVNAPLTYVLPGIGLAPIAYTIPTGAPLLPAPIALSANSLTGTPNQPSTTQTTITATNTVGNVSAPLNLVIVAELDVEQFAGLQKPVSGSTYQDNVPALAAPLSSPFNLALDPSGNAYIADTASNHVRVVDTTGKISTFVGGATLNSPIGVAVDSGGNVYISESGAGDILKATNGNLVKYGPSGQLTTPKGIAIDNKGNLYVADTGHHCIQRIDSSQNMSVFAGVSGSSGFIDGVPATSAKLSSPVGVAVDGNGNVLIADTGNHCIRSVNSAGIITTIAGTGGTSGYDGDGGPASMAHLYAPQGVCVDSTGLIYVADTSNHEIRRIEHDKTIVSIGGTNKAGNSADAIPGLAAQFNSPTGVATDATGALYIADEGNNRVRKLIPPPGPLQIASDISASPNPALVGQNVTFTVAASGGVAPVSYAWNFNDGSSDNNSSTQHAYAAAGNYTVMVKISDAAGGSITRTVAVQVNATNDVPAEILTALGIAPTDSSLANIQSDKANSMATPKLTFKLSYGASATKKDTITAKVQLNISPAPAFSNRMVMDIGAVAKAFAVKSVPKGKRTSYTAAPNTNGDTDSPSSESMKITAPSKGSTYTFAMTLKNGGYANTLMTTNGSLVSLFGSSSSKLSQAMNVYVLIDNTIYMALPSVKFTVNAKSKTATGKN